MTTILYLIECLPIQCPAKKLILGVARDGGLKMREAGKYRPGDYVCLPQRLGLGNYTLAAIHKTEHVAEPTAQEALRPPSVAQGGARRPATAQVAKGESASAR